VSIYFYLFLYLKAAVIDAMVFIELHLIEGRKDVDVDVNVDVDVDVIRWRERCEIKWGLPPEVIAEFSYWQSWKQAYKSLIYLNDVSTPSSSLQLISSSSHPIERPPSYMSGGTYPEDREEPRRILYVGRLSRS